jgi:hypothetical protein
MRDPHPRPSVLTVAANPGRSGFLLELLARLLPPARSSFGAGYALRRRQEANRARLACPACRAAGREAAPALIRAESRRSAARGDRLGRLPDGPTAPTAARRSPNLEPLESNHGI